MTTTTQLQPGTHVIYIPQHAHGDTMHPSAEYGYIEKMADDGLSALVRYWHRGTRELRTTANGEWTPMRDLISMADMPQDQHGGPIIFTSDNIHPILAGTKTQTRRTRGLDEINANPDAWRVHDHDVDSKGRFGYWMASGKETAFYPCLYSSPTNKLWVRETFAIGSEGKVYYRASDPHPLNSFKWTHGMFMPYSQHRIDLRATEYRLERIKALTTEDAIAEGAYRTSGIRSDAWRVPGFDKGHNTAREAYFHEWDSINPDLKVECNPWVWVVEFKLL